jgi:hypothetical protein
MRTLDDYVKMSRLGIWDAPLEIVGPRVFVFSVGTEWTDVTGRLMHEPMPDHFVFPLEALSTFSSWTIGNGAVMGTTLRVHICVGTKERPYQYVLSPSCRSFECFRR